MMASHDTQLSCAFCSHSSAAESFGPGILTSQVVVGIPCHHQLFVYPFNSFPSSSSAQGLRDSSSLPLIPRRPACSMLLCVNANTHKQDLVDDLTHDEQRRVYDSPSETAAAPVLTPLNKQLLMGMIHEVPNPALGF